MLAAATRWSDLAAPRARSALRVPAASAVASLGPTALCPPGTLPDARVCIPVPARGTAAEGFGSDPDRIPRRPDRPADFARYDLPVKDAGAVLPAAPLGAPTTQTVDPAAGGIDIETNAGQEVRLVALDGQTGPGVVAYTGEFIGQSVVVRQHVHESGEDREYLVVYGRLSAIAPSLEPERSLEPGALIGLAGARSPTGGVTVHLQIRRLRQGVTTEDLLREQVLDPSVTLAEDPRNLLRLR